MLLFELRWKKEQKSPEWFGCLRAPCEVSAEPHFLGTKFQRDLCLSRGRLCAGELELLCFLIFNFPAAVTEWQGCEWDAALTLHTQPCSHGPMSQNYHLNPVSPAPELLKPESCCEGSAGALTLAKLHIPLFSSTPLLFSCYLLSDVITIKQYLCHPSQTGIIQHLDGNHKFKLLQKSCQPHFSKAMSNCSPCSSPEDPKSGQNLLVTTVLEGSGISLNSQMGKSH